MNQLLGAEPIPTVNKPCIAELFFDHREHLVFIADAAVRDEHDLAKVRFLYGCPQRRRQRRAHFRATIGLELLHELQRIADVRGVGRNAVSDRARRRSS